MVVKYLLSLFLVLYSNLFSYSLFAQVAKPFGTELDTSNNHNAPKKNCLRPGGFIIPVSFLLYGTLKPVVKGIAKIDDDIYNHVQNKYPDFHTNADDYLMWAPSASIYVLDVFNVKTKHTFTEHLILDAGSILITGGIGYAMRLSTHNNSSYSEDNTKFPSGHSANAFRGAEIFHQELKDVNSVLSYGGYLVATSVGALRIFNKAHMLSQVIAGAGLGILSAKLTYWIFCEAKSHRRHKT